jgi:hypothetical protein
VSLSPGDPTLWACVIFVRSGMLHFEIPPLGCLIIHSLSGPYASAILRFQIRFPPTYPDRPPLVTFSTDVFHPLIVPLTTYTFSTGVSNEDPVSASDEQRLAPGGFSLRHAFPHWFGRARRTGVGSAPSSRSVSLNADLGTTAVQEESAQDASTESEQRDDNEEGEPTPAPTAEPVPKIRTSIPVLEILDYIRTSFDDETVLDSVPLEAAGNPSAWHAWKAHRKDTDTAPASDSKRDNPQARAPGDWNWDGIWIRRVQYEIEGSRSDATLFGSAARGAPDELVRFYPEHYG